MTTPDPVSPTSPVRTSRDTTDGSTRAAMSATDPGSRVTAGATVASWNAGSSTAAGNRLAAKTPMAAPIAPITSAATSTPMIADGRNRRSNSACRRVNRSAGTGSATSGTSACSAGGPSRAPAFGSRHGSPGGSACSSGASPAGGRPRLSPPPPGRPKASSRNSGTGGAPSITGVAVRRAPKEPPTPPGRPNAPACNGSTGGFHRGLGSRRGRPLRRWLAPPVAGAAATAGAGAAVLARSAGPAAKPVCWPLPDALPSEAPIPGRPKAGGAVPVASSAPDRPVPGGRSAGSAAPGCGLFISCGDPLDRCCWRRLPATNSAHEPVCRLVDLASPRPDSPAVPGYGSAPTPTFDLVNGSPVRGGSPRGCPVVHSVR